MDNLPSVWKQKLSQNMIQTYLFQFFTFKLFPIRLLLLVIKLFKYLKYVLHSGLHDV